MPNDLSPTDSLNMSMALIDRMEGTQVRGGKTYHDVSQRIEAFRAFHPRHQIKTEMILNDGKMLVFKASIFDPEGKELATGHAEEVRGSTNVNKTSALENCETSAIGRCLAQMGLHGGNYASLNELLAVPDKAEKLKQWDAYQGDLKKAAQQSTEVQAVVQEFPDAKVKRVSPHGTFQAEMMEKWQSITTKQLVEYRQTKTNEEVRNILTRWREEAMACFNLCQTREQYLTVETRLIDELKEIESAGQGKWVEAFHKNLGGKIAEISDRIDAAQSNKNPKTAAVL